jgi:glycosyltransferase involved in cell wall biosynthesis
LQVPHTIPDASTSARAPLGVTVLMPVYNGERYLAEAIESVLAQTHPHFELLIIDDGSTDRTAEILDRYAARDARIRVFHQENVDQPATLNRGLELARYDWVAILDHDDVCLPERLARQVEMLEHEPEARIVGTWAIEISATGEPLQLRSQGPETVDEFHKWHAEGRRVPLIHPSVMMHRATILALGGYDPIFSASADSELWTRVAMHHPIVVVPEPLLLYRIHRQSMSFQRVFEQRERLRWIHVRDEARRGGRPVPSTDNLHPSWSERLRQRHHDLFWLVRSQYWLAVSEHKRWAAAALAVSAGLLAPQKAIRGARRWLASRARLLS